MSGPVPEDAAKPNRRLMLARLTSIVRNAGAGIVQRPSVVRPEVLEQLYRQEPLLTRGIQKHSGDVVKHWFRLVKPGTTEEHQANKAFQAWARQKQLKAKTRNALISSHVYGDGFFEYEWSDKGLSTVEAPPPPGNRLLDVHLIDAATVRLEKHVRRQGKDRVLEFELVQMVEDMVRLHPTRYDHVRLKTLPGFVHGIASVEAAYHAALSKIKGDQAVGEILFYAGQPYRRFGVNSEDQDDIATVTKMVQSPEFQRGIVWDNSLTVEQFNPEGIDPGPYHAIMKSSIAAAIGIPVMLLEGAQAGAVEGSETNLDDYQGDLRGVQELITPVMERIASGVTGLPTDAFEVYWEPFPTSPQKEAMVLREKFTAFSMATTSGVTKQAAAKLLKLDLSDDDFTEDEEPPNEAPMEPEPMEDPVRAGRNGTNQRRPSTT